MKKFSTLCMALACFAGVAQAQQNDKSFRFIEKLADGSYVEVPDGSVLNYTAADAEEAWGTVQIKPALFVENVAGKQKAISLTMNIANINEGAAIQFCAAGNCQAFGEAGEYTKNGMEAAGNIDDMLLEYIPANDEDEDGELTPLDGAASISLRADVCSYSEEESKWGTPVIVYGEVTGVGPQININFNFNYTGIESTENPSNGVVEEVARYNAAGQRVNGPVKGLNIVKLANGKTVKQLYK